MNAPPKAPGVVWFRPKLYGYGATPVTWQGWALVAVFVAAVVAAAMLLVGKASPPVGNVVAFFIVEIVLLAALWVISQRTTDGAWRWRWGADRKSENADHD